MKFNEGNEQQMREMLHVKKWKQMMYDESMRGLPRAQACK